MLPERFELVFEPADDVTDLDEWFAVLDGAIALGSQGRWDANARCVRVEVIAEHLDEVIRAVRGALGDAVSVTRAGEPLVLDVTGAAYDR